MATQQPDFIPAAQAASPIASPAAPDFIPAAPPANLSHSIPDFIPAPVGLAPSSTQGFKDAIERTRQFLAKPLTDYLPQKIQPFLGLFLEPFPYIDSQAHPILGGINKGVADLDKSFTSPANLILAIGSGGLGSAAPVVSRLLSAGFSVESLVAAWQGLPQIRDAISRGDSEGAARLLTGEVGNLVVAGVTGLHAIRGTPAAESTPAGKVGEGTSVVHLAEQPAEPPNTPGGQLDSMRHEAQRLEAGLRDQSAPHDQLVAAETKLATLRDTIANIENSPAAMATQQAVDELHETINGHTLDISTDAGSQGNGSVVSREPAISEPADKELANGGITVIHPGKDLGLIARYLGSITQQAARLNNPFFQAIANKIADITIALARNSRDAIQQFRSATRSIITPEEWEKQVVPLLNNPDVSLNNLPDNLPDNIKQAYINERTRLDNDRLEIIKAKRDALVNSGMTRAAAIEAVPDEWGIKQGYYHHAFPGNWTIMQRTEGGDWEPIDTGWRQITLDAAQDKAKEYLAANPDAELQVKLDSATLPGSNYTDKARLFKLMADIKAASTLIYNGANPDGILADLKEKAAAATYGPRKPAQRMNPAILQREANLPGWAADIDNYERYIIGIERYKQMAPARQYLIKLRNSLAESTGMSPIQRISEIPKRYSGQYANMLGRVDASIEALEGYPTGFDAAIRNRLQQLGYDPNMIDRAYSFVNSAEALLKLGFNLASAGLHMAQTLAATYPVLGEKYTLSGLLHSYDSQYADLVHDLGIQATSNLLDIDTFRAYRGGYFNSPGLGSMLSGAYHVLSDAGLFMFSKGVETAKRIAAIGAYQKAIDMGMSPAEARNYARDQLIRTQFLYSPADAPIALRLLPRPLTQFRNFTIKMMEFTTGLRGAEIPRFLIAMGLIGYAGLPALSALSSMIEYTTGYNPENELKRGLPRASRGILGLLGVDYTNNIGFADWLGSRSFDPDKLAGPAGNDILNLGKAAIASLKGPSREGQQDISTALRNVSPEFRRLWDESKRLADGNGNLIDPRSGSIIISNLSPGERLELLSGLTPIRVAEERDIHDQILNEINSAKDKRGYFVDKIASLQLEMMRGDLNPQQHMQLVQEVANLATLAQANNVALGLPAAVKQRAKEMLQERLQRDVRLAPKAVRPGAYEQQQQFKQQQEGR